MADAIGSTVYSNTTYFVFVGSDGRYYVRRLSDGSHYGAYADKEQAIYNADDMIGIRREPPTTSASPSPLNETDYKKAMDIIVGLQDATASDMTRLDLNKNGIIDSGDVTLIAQDLCSRGIRISGVSCPGDAPSPVATPIAHPVAPRTDKPNILMYIIAAVIAFFLLGGGS